MGMAYSKSSPSITRRDVLRRGAGLALLASSSRLAEAAPDIRTLKLLVRPTTWDLGTRSRAFTTDVWAYDGTIPGPQIRVRQGVPVRILVENRLAEGTTVHWHGIRLPISMDGVPGLTQAPIAPGETFTYEFTPPDAGTFWYHPHANTLQQLGRGLAGALIVEEPETPGIERDVAWVISDWRLTSEGQLVGGFGNAMEAAMSGRVGNTVTVNGALHTKERVQAGERLRLRLINAALARIMALRFEGHRPIIIAVDGQPCEPHEPENGRVLLGPAMRADVLLELNGEPGRAYEVIDDFYQGLSYAVAVLSYGDEYTPRKSPNALVPLPRNPLAEPDLGRAETHVLKLQGGMMGGGNMAGMGGMHGMSHGATWAINGTSMTGDGHGGMPPSLTLQRGQPYVLRLQNETAWWHPMHLHGHSFRILSRNGAAVPYRQWADTVLLEPRDTVDVAFVADNPGDWMFHCHVTDHQVAGMMTLLRVA